jgi:transcriptional regulator with XRE-family HTH domain
MESREVGDRIRQVRRRLGLTQAEFAKRLGVIQVSMARYEAGRVPRADVLERMARLGGVTLSWVLRGELERQSPAGPLVDRTAWEPLRGLVTRLQGEFALVLRLPLPQRERYEERVKEVAARVVRELEEYRKVLEAESRTGRRTRRPRS